MTTLFDPLVEVTGLPWADLWAPQSCPRNRTVRMNGTVYCHKALQKTYSELGFRSGRRAPSATAFLITNKPQPI